MATTKAKATTPAAEKPVKAEPAAKTFTASRGFEDGKDGRKFAKDSVTAIGAKADDVSQADAARFEKAGHGKIA